MACLPARYKLVELLCYAVMGFFPALVILSMVSPTIRPGASRPAAGDCLQRVALEIVMLNPLLLQTGKSEAQGSAACVHIGTLACVLCLTSIVVIDPLHFSFPFCLRIK